MTDQSALLFASLPQFMQDADLTMPGHPLASYAAGMATPMQAVSDLLDRLDHYRVEPQPATVSDLTDADAADPAWLDWLAQTVAVRLGGISDEVARRDAVRDAPAGWRAGTKPSIANAARSALIGPRYVKVYDHSEDAIGDGSEWDLLLVTRVSDTPDVDAVLAAVVAKGARPAGVVLHHKAYSATYAQVVTGTSPDTYAARLASFPTYRIASDYLPPGA